MLKIDEMAAQNVSIFDVFWQNGQNASPIYLLNLTALHIKLDQVTRILNLQSESKNVENWRNGGPKSVDFLRFFGKMAKRVTYLYSESHGTAYPARPSYQEPKSSIGFEKCWKLTKWRSKKCWFFTFFLFILTKLPQHGIWLSTNMSSA